MTSKQAAELYRRVGAEAPAGIAAPDASKYSARKKMLDGFTFASTLEADAYVVLKHWERSGAITGLELQPAFELQAAFVDGTGKRHRAVRYVADFRFRDHEGECVVDAKGFQPPIFKLKLKLFRSAFPSVRLELWTRQQVREFSR